MKSVRLPVPSRIRWQLIAATLIITTITTVIGSILLLFAFASYALDYEERSLTSQSQLIASYLEARGYSGESTRNLLTEVAGQVEESSSRIILLDAGGLVVIDSKGTLQPGAKPELEFDLNQRLVGGGAGHLALGWTPLHGYDAYAVAPIRSGDQLVGDVVLIQRQLRPGWNFDFAPSLIFGRVTTSAISVLLILIFAALIARPLEKMTAVARKIATGDLGARVKSYSQGEVGELAHAIDSMANSLEETLSKQQQLDRVRRELLADASHEIRTPLARMHVAVQALLDKVVETPADQREYLENIKEDILQLSRLTADLFDLSKMELGQVAMSIEPVPVKEMLESTAIRFRPMAEAQGVSIAVSTPPSPKKVLADRDRVGQVLANLIGNALRYTPPGGTISLGADVETNQATIRVSDTGPGIPPEALAHVFDRFYRVDRSRSRQSGGTGLGLTIAREIIRAHSGEIAVESTPGKGTHFSFTLPLVAEHEEQFAKSFYPRGS